ncbi:glycosyltransferase [bacterium]|nr:glycosyltransferase [bacterium]
MSISILHIAPQNFAGVPYSIVKAERKSGFDSCLITMWPHPYGFKEDECLDLPLVAGNFITKIQRALKTTPQTLNLRRKDLNEIPPKWRGDKFPAKQLFALRDKIWEKRLIKAGFPKRLNDYDIVVLDGGIPLLRSGKWILDWVLRGGKLATTYYGSDLRQHGVIPKIDKAASVVFVMEFDHRFIHPRSTWLPFPFDPINLPNAKAPNGPIRIGHVASHRSAKGTNEIISAINNVARRIHVEPVIIEKKPHAETIALKSSCHIFIDQLGELGYGISGLESVAMGIPTVVELLPDHEKFLGSHPFAVANKKTLPDVLVKLALNKNLRMDMISRGKIWLDEFHNPIKTTNIIIEKYNELGWIS